MVSPNQSKITSQITINTIDHYRMLSDNPMMDKYIHPKKTNISENVMEEPALKRVRITENPELEEINGVPDIANSLADEPNQPNLKSYPKRKFGTKFRSFQKEWFHTRPWLEYSQVADAAFCYCCRAFCRAVFGSDQWTKLGFTNWKNAMEEKSGLKAHEISNSHLESALKWSSCMKSEQTGTIASRILCISRQEILENRGFLANVVPF